MCVMATAKRRRRQAKLDKRYRIRTPEALTRRESKRREKEIVGGKRK